MGSVSQPFVTVHALDAGYLTLPESAFVTPLEDRSARSTVPSLSFLVQHHDPVSGEQTRIVFDLGIRKELRNYAPRILTHAMTRQPLSGDPDTVASLARGGLTPDDIDVVMFSHLHWDHIGTPSDYPSSAYVVGNGAAALVDGSRPEAIGSHNHFEQGLLDEDRLVELPPTVPSNGNLDSQDTAAKNRAALTPRTQAAKRLFTRGWETKGPFEATMDVFGDGSLRVVAAPGHLDGHINLLCRLSEGRTVYLAGDSCHDRRILTGEKDIATWDDPESGRLCCIHKDKKRAMETIGRIREAMTGETELGAVQVILAHDPVWEREGRARGSFFPGSI